jgi:aminoglycoside 6-adenylyltransferase
MMELILSVAADDERIRAVSMEGSRANPNVRKDEHMDYDISYYVNDIMPFYNNPGWVTEKFGRPLIMQMPETMRYPENDGHFSYLMLFPDGNRIDLSFNPSPYEDDGEPSLTLLDKDDGKGFRPTIPPPNDKIYHIKPPDELFYYSCCNNFWWCLNNVAKGVARDELPYVMNMLSVYVRTELHDMISWYIGVNHGFNLSTGKDCKYFKNYLPPDIYKKYTNTYSDAKPENIWQAVYVMCDLFRELALFVAEFFGFTYRQNEEDAIREYMRMVKESK